MGKGLLTEALSNVPGEGNAKDALWVLPRVVTFHAAPEDEGRRWATAGTRNPTGFTGQNGIWDGLNGLRHGVDGRRCKSHGLYGPKWNLRRALRAPTRG